MTFKRHLMNVLVLLVVGILTGMGCYLLYDVGGWELPTAVAFLYCSYAIHRFYIEYMEIKDQTKRLEKLRLFRDRLCEIRDDMGNIRDELKKKQEKDHEQI